MVPVKSSIGLISSKISSSPDCSGTSWRDAVAASTRAFQRSLPSSQSKESVCSASRLGTSSGSLIRAKETRCGPRAFFDTAFVEAAFVEALRDAANRGPSELVADVHRTHAKRPAGTPREVRCCRGRQSAAQKSSVAERHTAGQQYASTMRFTLTAASLLNGETSSLTRLVPEVGTSER